MLLAPNGVTIFFSSLEKHTVSWHISWQATESLAAELNAKLQDPTTAQVPWQASDVCKTIMRVFSMLTFAVVRTCDSCLQGFESWNTVGGLAGFE